MVYRIRTALVWLMLVALPLHGFASAGMLHCVGVPMPASQSSDQAIASIGMDRAGGTLLLASAQPPTPDCGAMSASVHSSKSSTGHCAASAACDIVAAPFPQVLAVVAPAASAAPPLSRPATGFGFFTDAPDRPPRVLA
jgi:hypothetical protein